jgi:RIO kinase 2
VSSAEKAAKLLPEINNREIRVLQAIELGMIQHEIVPMTEILRYSGFDLSETEFQINSLHKKELIYRQSDPYLGFLLNYAGYDALALNALVKGDYLEALGAPIGVGKESDVFEALDPEENQVVIKFHRLGRTSFRETRRKRQYLADRRHISWLYQSRLAAEKEFEALVTVSEGNVDVPNPMQQNRHIVVMQMFYGDQLSNIDSIVEPETVLETIIENIKKAYQIGIIHADLSEFNVLIGENNEISIIDWPQFIKLNHPNSEEFLERDVKNILIFFDRKFNVKKGFEDAIEKIKN